MIKYEDHGNILKKIYIKVERMRFNEVEIKVIKDSLSRWILKKRGAL